MNYPSCRWVEKPPDFTKVKIGKEVVMRKILEIAVFKFRIVIRIRRKVITITVE